MKMKRLAAAVLICVVAGTPILAQGRGAPAPDVASLQKEVASLKETVAALSKSDHDRDGSTLDLWTEILRLDGMLNAHATADLDITSRTYRQLDTGIGPLLLSLAKVEPYLDGHKLTFLLGNPSYLTYNGFTLTLRWGPRFDGDNKHRAAWAKAIQNKSFEQTIEVKPGQWNPFEIIIAPAAPDALGYLQASLEINLVSFQPR